VSAEERPENLAVRYGWNAFGPPGSAKCCS
jgi:hypothetical protein